ncbi:MAG: fibronectin type III domain-containing protein [Planctomycetales bacterium]|nr:fibronectin type III domain-containing protein [Planctomycetales bacterium]
MKFFRRLQRRDASTASAWRKLRVEGLERRELLAADVVASVESATIDEAVSLNAATSTLDGSAFLQWQLQASDWQTLFAATNALSDRARVSEPPAPAASPASSWSQLTSLPRLRAEHTALEVGGKIYVLGGIYSHTQGFCEIDVYDPQTGEWSLAGDMARCRHHFNAVSYADRYILVLGGKTGNDASGVRWADRFDTATGEWTQLPALPEVKWGGPAVVAEGRVHLLAGAWDSEGISRSHYSLDLQDFAAGWRSEPRTLMPTVHSAAAYLDGKIYVMGGEGNHLHPANEQFDVVQVYDLATQSWSYGESLPAPRNHMETSTFVYGGEIWSVAGVDSSLTPRGQSDMFIYNPQLQQWRVYEQALPSKFVSPASLTIGDTLYVLGGWIGDWELERLSDKVWTLDLQDGDPLPTPAPGEPESLDVEAAIGEVRLTWPDAGDIESGYVLERAINDGAFEALATLDADSTSHVDASVAIGDVYSYRIAAFNSAGRSAYQYSSPIQPLGETPVDDQLPPGPTSVISLGGVAARSATLHWEDELGTAAGYLLQRAVVGEKFFDLASLPAEATTYQDDGLLPATPYSYRVAATNSYGQSDFRYSPVFTTLSEETPVNEAEPPSPPSAITSSDVSSGSVTLAWSDPAGTAEGYSLQRSVNGGKFNDLIELSAETLVYSDATLQPETFYAYRIVATNAYGSSAFRYSVPFTTPADVAPPVEHNPPQPTSVISIVSVTSRSSVVEWIDEQGTAEGFILQRAVVAGKFVDVATLPADTTHYEDASLSPATQYSYRVAATNEYGESDFRYSPLFFTESDEVPTGEVGPPSPTSPLEESSVGSRSATLNWSDPGGTAEEFLLQRSTSGGKYNDLVRLPATATEYTDATLQPGTVYDYRIAAINAYGQSSYRYSAPFTTTLDDSVVHIEAIDVSSNVVEIGWSAYLSDAMAISLQRASRGGRFVELARLPSSEMSYRDVAVAPGTTYFYRIAIIHPGGEETYAYSEPVIIPGAVSSFLGVESPPDAPTSLNANYSSRGDVRLAWQREVANATHFVVERSVNGAAFQTIAVLGRSTDAYDDLEVDAGNWYVYRISALNSLGVSQPTFSGPVWT